jgi:hypothetical protein
MLNKVQEQIMYVYAMFTNCVNNTRMLLSVPNEGCKITTKASLLIIAHLSTLVLQAFTHSLVDLKNPQPRTMSS